MIRKTLISIKYIKVIHRLEIFSISAQTTHILNQFEIDPDTLIAVNAKTEPPLISPGKKSS